MFRMENLRVWPAGLTLLLLLGRLACCEPVNALPSTSLCPLSSLKYSILGSRGFMCSINRAAPFHANAVIEGDDASFERALNMIHQETHDYVSLLFYASWCPFSKTVKPSFSALSSLYPSIPHFAVEKSAIRPSILSRFGVHGFPALFLLNSSMLLVYHGSRTLDSLIGFYTLVTGIEPSLVDGKYLDRSQCPLDKLKHVSDEENRPFSWIRSPENLVSQETYLSLATAFVLMRLVCIVFPYVWRLVLSWRRYIVDLRLRNLWEHPLVYLNLACQLLNSLKEPRKRSNLQEGAINARVWASKSLASVSFGDAGTSRVVSVN